MSQPTTEAVTGLVYPCLYKPQYLHIEPRQMDAMIVYNITVHPDDIRYLIGRGGENIAALKAMFNQIGNVRKLAIRLSLLEWHPGNRNPPTRIIPWTLDIAEAGLKAYFAALRFDTGIAIVQGRPGQQLVMLSKAPPLAVSGPLQKWLPVMGAPGKIKLILDDSTPEDED